jgi:hypothetical protein
MPKRIKNTKYDSLSFSEADIVKILREKLSQLPEKDQLIGLIREYIPKSLTNEFLLGKKRVAKLHMGQKIYARYDGVSSWSMDKQTMENEGLLYKGKYVEVEIIGFNPFRTNSYKIQFIGRDEKGKHIDHINDYGEDYLLSEGENDYIEESDNDIMHLRDFQY